jgi:hypothetical protein
MMMAQQMEDQGLRHPGHRKARQIAARRGAHQNPRNIGIAGKIRPLDQQHEFGEPPRLNPAHERPQDIVRG